MIHAAFYGVENISWSGVFVDVAVQFMSAGFISKEFHNLSAFVFVEKVIKSF